MKLFVTGATGVLGRPTVAGLVAAGHEVRALARGDDAADRLGRAGAEPVAVDLFDAAAVHDAVGGGGGVDAVLHLATSVPPLRRAFRRGAWDLHNRIRTEATRNVVAAARAGGATRFVKESVTFMYADGRDRWLAEDAPLASPLGMLEATVDGERIALDFAGGGRAAVVLRFGLFYGGPGNRGTDEMLRLARFGLSTIIGRPEAYMSSIHMDDAAAATVRALDLETGVYNVVDDRPLTRREHLDAFASAFGTRRLRPTPQWLARLTAGSVTAALAASQRVTNRRLRDTAGWVPAHPDARQGWAEEAASREEASRA